MKLNNLGYTIYMDKIMTCIIFHISFINCIIAFHTASTKVQSNRKSNKQQIVDNNNMLTIILQYCVYEQRLINLVFIICLEHRVNYHLFYYIFHWDKRKYIITSCNEMLHYKLFCQNNIHQSMFCTHYFLKTFIIKTNVFSL